MIEALEFRPSLPKLVAARALRRSLRGALSLRQHAIPRRPSPEWVNVRPRLSGICGSDQALLDGHASPYLGALTSAPFVPGHEVVGDVVSGPDAGARVVLHDHLVPAFDELVDAGGGQRHPELVVLGLLRHRDAHGGLLPVVACANGEDVAVGGQVSC